MHNGIKHEIPDFKDQQPFLSTRNRAKWFEAASVGVAQVERKVDPAHCRTVIHLKDEPDDVERERSARQWAEKGRATREKIRGLRNKVRADYKRGDRLFRLAQAYTVQAIARRYGLTRGQVTAMCRRLP